MQREEETKEKVEDKDEASRERQLAVMEKVCDGNVRKWLQKVKKILKRK